MLALGLMYGFLLLRYRYGWMRLVSRPCPPPAAAFHTRVSVIIPARNEAENIPPLLQALTAQQYPPHLLEIIIIDDFSTDDTAALVKACAAPYVRLLQMSEHFSIDQRLNAYKKKAIEIAIGISTGDLIITTDADCVMGPEWIASIVQCYEFNRPKFIAAPVAFHREDTFFKQWQSLDFITMQGITGAASALHSGSMCNGANLAYEKAVFYEVDGFHGIDNIASGDDMLLMYKIFKVYPNSIEYIPREEAIVYTLPIDNWKGFMNQRIRWSSKADKYDDKSLIRVLVIFYFWNVCLVVLPLCALFMTALWWWWAGLCAYKILLELYFLWPVTKFFKRRFLLKILLPGQPLHILYVIMAGWLGKFGTYEWKGRRVK
ncbi:Glycosyltransferase, catalytic subunit of cellulose synthase and poly-beta-1,6-N-acetylglucosamine synthase [Chitinophaga costaii]|uniref:Glycosyltransferase, catalytic subunit of cellulose synthase and poly-beta-1,6-N-acetylglucosamine synthase n=2 Tax=Chitinophaga costaii TaxID=1335309 RepID=A0A1C4F554_9BACT|nr:Glycosyltransferase, catalytic subunit of cellulose synthase and poly-beta-1,6-N-acetylglucosamine synthase [Chitinophaga costaii]